MTLSLLLPRRQGKIGSLTIEATLSENHNFKSTVTRFPIEGGSIVSDHIVNDPEQVKIEGFISNTPVKGEVDNHAQSAFDMLFAMWEAKELISVVTEHRIYVDMAITDITVPRNAKTGQSIQFSADLMKVRKIQSTTVSVSQDKLASTVVDQASTSYNLGQRTTSTASDTIAALTTEQMIEYKGVA